MVSEEKGVIVEKATAAIIVAVDDAEIIIATIKRN